MNAPLLLDTCVVIWIVEGQLGAAAAALLADRHRKGETVFLSPISAWELGNLFSRGRLRSPISPVEYFRRVSMLPHVHLAQMPPEVLMNSCLLPGTPPRDPADRIIAATARAYGYTVMTSDRLLLAYAREGHLRVLEC